MRGLSKQQSVTWFIVCVFSAFIHLNKINGRVDEKQRIYCSVKCHTHTHPRSVSLSSTCTKGIEWLKRRKSFTRPNDSGRAALLWSSQRDDCVLMASILINWILYWSRWTTCCIKVVKYNHMTRPIGACCVWMNACCRPNWLRIYTFIELVSRRYIWCKIACSKSTYYVVDKYLIFIVQLPYAHVFDERNEKKTCISMWYQQIVTDIKWRHLYAIRLKSFAWKIYFLRFESKSRMR